MRTKTNSGPFAQAELFQSCSYCWMCQVQAPVSKFEERLQTMETFMFWDGVPPDQLAVNKGTKV